MKRTPIIAATLACLVSVATLPGCADDESARLHTDEQLLDALLTVADVQDILPADWEENMRKVIEAPVPPWENTLDPYLCTEAETPEAMTRSQAQLELTGGSVMEVLLAADDAPELYDEIVEAYAACGATSSLPYTALADGPAVGDESSSYRSSLGVVTIARFDTDLMILKWWVGDFYDEAIQYYPDIVEAAAERIGDI